MRLAERVLHCAESYTVSIFQNSVINLITVDSFFRYVKKQCKYMKVDLPPYSRFYSYYVWISLSSTCDINDNVNDVTPCQTGSSLVVVKGTLSSSYGLDGVVQSCWSGVDIHGIVGKGYVDSDGDVAFHAGYLSCCPVGGKIGETNNIPVTVKLKFIQQAQRTSISGLSDLQHCEKHPKPINATIYVPFAGDLVKWNYTLPSLMCHVIGLGLDNNLTNAPVFTVRPADTIQCSLYNNVSIDRVRCAFSNSSAALRVTVSCSGKETSVRDVDMEVTDDYKYHGKIQVSNRTRPGCLLMVTGRYLKPLATEWMDVKEPITFQVAEEHGDASLSVILGTSIGGGLGAIVAIALLVYVVWKRCSHRTNSYRPLGNSEPAQRETDSSESGSPPEATRILEIYPPLDDALITNGSSSQQIACLYREGNEKANEVIEQLESEGITLRKYLQPGKAITKAIVEKLERCHKILILLSRDYLCNEKFSCYAISQAVVQSIIKKGKVVVIPVVLDDCEIPAELEQLVKLDINKSVDFWKRLLEEIRDKKLV